MGIGDIIAWTAVIALVCLCLKNIRKNMRSGSCGGCSSCSAGKCAACSGGKINKFKMTLDIEGMACNMCEAHVNDALRKAFPGNRVQSSYKKNQAVVTGEHIIHEEELKAALDPTGYRLLKVHTEAC